MSDVALRPYNVLSICAGTGALDLGIEIARPGARSVCMVERGAYQAELLAARMENGDLSSAPIWSDATSFDPDPWRGIVDCVASGDPCQPNSKAGKMLGPDDPRWLLDHVLRIVDGVRPRRFFRENVPGNADGQIGHLVPALEGMGFRVACGMFTARGAGAWQGRERLFLMADRDGEGPSLAQHTGEPRATQRGHEPRSAADELHRLGAAGSLVNDHGGGGSRLSADEGKRSVGRTAARWAGDLALFAPGPRDHAWGDVFRDTPGLKPAIRRVADGMAHRMDRIESAGNGVVSLVAARAWLGLEARLHGTSESAALLVRMMEEA